MITLHSKKFDSIEFVKDGKKKLPLPLILRLAVAAHLRKQSTLKGLLDSYAKIDGVTPKDLEDAKKNCEGQPWKDAFSKTLQAFSASRDALVHVDLKKDGALEYIELSAEQPQAAGAAAVSADASGFGGSAASVSSSPVKCAGSTTWQCSSCWHINERKSDICENGGLKCPRKSKKHLGNVAVWRTEENCEKLHWRSWECKCGAGHKTNEEECGKCKEKFDPQTFDFNGKCFTKYRSIAPIAPIGGAYTFEELLNFAHDPNLHTGNQQDCQCCGKSAHGNSASVVSFAEYYRLEGKDVLSAQRKEILEHVLNTFGKCYCTWDGKKSTHPLALPSAGRTQTRFYTQGVDDMRKTWDNFRKAHPAPLVKGFSTFDLLKEVAAGEGIMSCHIVPLQAGGCPTSLVTSTGVQATEDSTGTENGVSGEAAASSGAIASDEPHTPSASALPSVPAPQKVLATSSAVATFSGHAISLGDRAQPQAATQKSVQNIIRIDQMCGLCQALDHVFTDFQNRDSKGMEIEKNAAEVLAIKKNCTSLYDAYLKKSTDFREFRELAKARNSDAHLSSSSASASASPSLAPDDRPRPAAVAEER